MIIRGNISLTDNKAILNFNLNEEKAFNDPSIAFEWVAKRYKDNEIKYGKKLYEAETINFIDTDMFRQAALRFLDTGKYEEYDEDENRKKYIEFWDIEEYRCKHGMTAYSGLDENNKPRLVHCPARFYGFLNYGIMLMVEDEKDEEIDSLSKVDNKEDIKETITTISSSAKKKLSNILKGLTTNKTGSKVISLPNFFDGQYHIAVAKEFARLLGLNFFLGKKRRAGQSYWNAWCAFHHYNFTPESTVIQAAHDKAYLTKGKGLFKMVKLYADHINKHTDWKRSRLKDTSEHIRSGYTYQGDTTERGYKSEVIAVSAQHNSDVTIGKDCVEVQYEELGKFPNFRDSFGVTTSTTEAGDLKTGQITGWGTGGVEEANWAEFENVFYNPENFDALACNNIWDTGAEGTACCLFFPHVQSLEGHMDIYGNTNYKTAWASFKAKKEYKRSRVTDEKEFSVWCGQRANSGSEAFSRNSSNIFDTEAIQTQLNKIIKNPKILNAHREGVLVKSSKGIRLKTNSEIIKTGGIAHSPVYDFPLKSGTDKNGCWVEWLAPYIDKKTGRVPENLYVAFQDPYSHDKDSKELTTRHSLGATYIFEITNNITPFGGNIPVAAYVGRPNSLDYYNKQVLLGLEYYNAKLVFESNTGDTKSYMQRMNQLHRLFEEPSLEFDKDVSGKTGRGYGINMSAKRKPKAAIYLRDFLNQRMGKDADTGEEKTVLNYIYDPALLKELLKWRLKGNFDRVSAWFIFMFIIKQLEYEEIEIKSVHDEDSFFNRIFF